MYSTRGGSDLAPNFTAPLDRLALSDQRALQMLARLPGERPPADREQWAAWAKGQSTTGPRYDSLALADLRQRWHARRCPIPTPNRGLGVVGPWKDFCLDGQWTPGRALIRKGHAHRSPLVWIRPFWLDTYRAEWDTWRLPGLVSAECVGRTREEVQARVDAVLGAARITMRAT